MSIVAAFASPLGEPTAIASQTIARKYLESIRTRLGEALRAKGQPSLAARLDGDYLARGGAWRPEVGIARTALTSNRVELAALQLAAISAHEGLRLQAQIDEPSVLAVDGWIVPVHGATAVETAGGQLRVSSASGQAEFRCNGGRMTRVASDAGMYWDVTAIDGPPPRYAIESRLGFSAGNFPWPATFQTAAGGARDHGPATGPVDALARAMRLVGEAAPEQAEWIGCVVDGFLLATGPATYGISSPDFPGLVALSSSGTELDYVEAVVAEACHQYLYQLLLVSPLTQAGTEEIHYIPARRFYLTTRRALVAAHVHANVILMLRQLATVPEHADSARFRIVRRMLMLDTDCLPALDNSAQLTAAGRELYSRVRELVAP